MENAAEALKMAFAVFIFVMALGVSVFAFSKVRETSDVVLHQSDITSFYEYEDYKKQEKLGENRTVSLDEIIPTLFRYADNDYTIIFKDGRSAYDDDTGEFNVNKLEDLPGLTIYESGAKDNNGVRMKISTFSLSEELARREPWTGSKESVLENLKAILEGKSVKYNIGTYNYASSANPLRNTTNNNKKKYLEYISSIPKDKEDHNDTTLKMQIMYILIKD